jgi:hypothetical protein
LLGLNDLTQNLRSAGTRNLHRNRTRGGSRIEEIAHSLGNLDRWIAGAYGLFIFQLGAL